MRLRPALLIACAATAWGLGAHGIASAQTLVVDPETGKMEIEKPPAAAPADAMQQEGADENSAQMKSALGKAIEEEQARNSSTVGAIGADAGGVMADSTLSQQIYPGTEPNVIRVAIHRSASSAEAAKVQAYSIAKREGLYRILQRQAPDRADALMQMLDETQMNSMIRTVQASREEMTGTTYRADLTVRFEPVRLEALIGGKLKKDPPEIPALPPLRGEASLVIPVWQEGEVVRLWEPDNNWRKALNRAALQESRGKLIMPYGDPMDQLVVTTAKLPTINFAELAHLAKRYGTADILLVQATPITGNAMNLTLTRLEPGNRSQTQQMITVPADQSRDTLLATAASYVAQLARQQFQSVNEAEQQQAEAEHRIRAIAPITRATDWASMRNRLNELPMVSSLIPMDIGPDKVEMEIVFRGTPDAFGNALKAANIHVTPQGNTLLLGFYPAGT